MKNHLSWFIEIVESIIVRLGLNLLCCFRVGGVEITLTYYVVDRGSCVLEGFLKYHLVTRTFWHLCVK